MVQIKGIFLDYNFKHVLIKGADNYFCHVGNVILIVDALFFGFLLG